MLLVYIFSPFGVVCGLCLWVCVCVRVSALERECFGIVLFLLFYLQKNSYDKYNRSKKSKKVFFFSYSKIVLWRMNTLPKQIWKQNFNHFNSYSIFLSLSFFLYFIFSLFLSPVYLSLSLSLLFLLIFNLFSFFCLLLNTLLLATSYFLFLDYSFYYILDVYGYSMCEIICFCFAFAFDIKSDTQLHTRV